VARLVNSDPARTCGHFTNQFNDLRAVTHQPRLRWREHEPKSFLMDVERRGDGRRVHEPASTDARRDERRGRGRIGPDGRDAGRDDGRERVPRGPATLRRAVHRREREQRPLRRLRKRLRRRAALRHGRVRRGHGVPRRADRLRRGMRGHQEQQRSLRRVRDGLLRGADVYGRRLRAARVRGGRAPLRRELRQPAERPEPLRRVRDSLPHGADVHGRRVRPFDGDVHWDTDQLQRDVRRARDEPRSLRRLWARVRERAELRRVELHRRDRVRRGADAVRRDVR
jgi:hypothetical protein